MAQTTVELRRLLALNNFKLFDFPYQFDDATFKAQLEQALIDFFYDYEIAFETTDMFKRKFIARWNRIIPFYNKLYNTTLLQYNPLINSKMSEALEQLSSSTNTTDSTSATIGETDSTTTTDSNNKTSDYPQQPIAGGDFLAGENEQKVSTVSAGADSSSTTGKVTGSGTSNSNYEKTVEGLTGTSYQSLIAQERENLLNIQVMVINEMKPCFMMVW